MSKVNTDRFGKSMTIRCPLVDNELIPDEDCFLMTTIADGMTPEECIEKKYREKKNFKGICLKCPNHRI